VKYWIGITDHEWYRYLAARPDLPEVNFWQPSAGRLPVRLDAGQLFLFKLHAPQGGWIVGGGWFLKYEAMPIRWTWEAFGIENGAATFDEMVARIDKYRSPSVDVHADRVGCLILVEPFFLHESEWIAPPVDWAPNIVRGKSYDSGIGEGMRIWNQVQLALARRMPAAEGQVAEARYGAPLLIRPRLGQGAFRLLVTDAYERRCAVTGERTLPVLDAAHIKPYADSGPHDVGNGLLLRKDLHALFDAGYLTVDMSLNLQVSRRIREEFENGRDYYALQGASVRLPLPPAPPPSAEYLEWHRDVKFRG
jgi:putative restriction endonuclease